MSETGLVPRLRFPEFRDAGDWVEKPLAKLVSTVTPPKKLQTADYAVSGKYPIVDQSQDCICGWTNDSDAIIRDDLPLIVFGDHTCVLKLIEKPFAQGADGIKILDTAADVSVDFLFQSLQAAPLEMKGYRRHFSILKEKRIAFPSIHSGEQQEIAGCLTSIDDLITAEAQKLDALTAHKKGLMQQLFPKQGETIPRLRFPEFRDAGDWEEKRLNQISTSIFDGTHQTPKYTKKGVPFFSVENIVSGKSNKFISREDYLTSTSKNKPEKGDVIITRIGNIGFPAIVDWEYEFSIYVTLAVIKKSDQFNSRYLYCYIQSEQYQAEIISKSLLHAVPCKINMDELRKTRILLPPPAEQQEIAGCLTSIDDLITAEAQQLEALKAHKKGLMQQLFPTSDEVGG